MTVLTKPSIVLKKPDGTKSPLVVENGGSDEERGDIYPQPDPSCRMRQRSAGTLFCMSVVALLVAVAGVSCGLLLYRQYLRSTGVRRYQGFCSIPIEPDYRADALQNEQLIEPNFNEHRVMPLRWSQEPDVQIFSVGDDEPLSSEANSRALNEEFEVGNRLETIRVYDNGRMVSFIHDFDDNVTGIIDQDRCFMMDLDPSLVLSPEMLIVGLENGDDFDITRVRSTLQALLPAVQELMNKARVLAERCMAKPTYRLQKEEGVIIRKRSADAPSHDYIQFAGNKVQEIEIANMAQLLEYEQALRQAQVHA